MTSVFARSYFQIALSALAIATLVYFAVGGLVDFILWSARP